MLLSQQLIVKLLVTASTKVKMKDELKVVCFSVSNLKNINEELKCLARTENLDVIIVTESFADTSSFDYISEYNIDGLTFFNKDRVNRRGGGIAF